MGRKNNRMWLRERERQESDMQADKHQASPQSARCPSRHEVSLAPEEPSVTQVSSNEVENVLASKKEINSGAKDCTAKALGISSEIRFLLLERP